MKRFASLALVLSSLTAGFIPTYIVEKYTARHSDGSFVNEFVQAGRWVPTQASKAAQLQFARSFDS